MIVSNCVCVCVCERERERERERMRTNGNSANNEFVDAFEFRDTM